MAGASEEILSVLNIVNQFLSLVIDVLKWVTLCGEGGLVKSIPVVSEEFDPDLEI